MKPTSEFYVNDFAGVLSEDTKTYILSNSAALSEKTKAQVVVVTLDSLDGKELSEYSLELFREWGIGDKSLKNGLLILLSVGDREVRIEVGDGLEGKINDSKAGRFLDEYGVPFFKSNEWNTGIKTLYSSLVSEIYLEYDMEMPEEVSEIVANFDDVSEDSKISMVIGFIVVALVLVFGGILPLIFRRKYPDRYRNGRNDGTSHNGGFWGGFGENRDFGGSSNFGNNGFSGGGGTSSGGGASRRF